MKNVLVVGGSSGIGLTLIDELLQKGGHRIYNVDIKYNEDLIGPVECYQCDLSNNDTIYEAIGLVLGDLAKHNISLSRTNPEEVQPGFDAVYYCAGIAEEPTADLKTDFNLIDKLIAVNSSSLIKVLSMVTPVIIPGGSIVVVSSAHSQRAANWNPIYSGTKGFIDAFVRSYAKNLVEAAHRSGNIPVRINAVNPEMVDTPLIHDLFIGKEDELQKVINGRILHRLLKPSEVTAVMHYLASPAASGVTGTVNPIGGVI